MELSTEAKIKKYGPRVLAVIALLFMVATCYDSTTTSLKLQKLQKKQTELEVKNEIAIEKEKAWQLEKQAIDKVNDSLLQVNKTLSSKNVKLNEDIVALRKKNTETKKQYQGKEYPYFADLLIKRYNAPNSIKTTPEGIIIANEVPKFIAEDLADLDTSVDIFDKAMQMVENEKAKNKNFELVITSKDKLISDLEKQKIEQRVLLDKAIKNSSDNLDEAIKQSKIKTIYKWAVPAAFVGGYLLAK